MVETASTCPSPPPPYKDVGRGETLVDQQKKSFAERILGLVRPQSGPRKMWTKDLELVVQKDPNILEIEAEKSGKGKVTVKVKVNVTVTVRSRHIGELPAVTATWRAGASAKETLRKSKRGNAKSVAFATEKATRKAAKDAYNEAVTAATIDAYSKALGRITAHSRGV